MDKRKNLVHFFWRHKQPNNLVYFDNGPKSVSEIISKYVGQRNSINETHPKLQSYLN